MITVSRLDGKEFVLNSDIIEYIETTPDTIITLTTGKKIIIKESVDDVIDKIIQYKQKIYYQYIQSVMPKRNEV